jgi:hypothetical protein
MSLIDTDENVLSQDNAEQGEGSKLVPVAESIRYRKRAQSAEKKNEALSDELAAAQEKAAQMAEQLSCMEVEQRLTCQLAAAGAVDLEAAVLLAKAKAKVEGKTDADVDGVVEQLKKEKQYLFAGGGKVLTAERTSPAKDRIQNGQTVLERAAKTAARTGNRTDLHEYLRLRRNFV